jgi:hypothetical protein
MDVFQAEESDRAGSLNQLVSAGVPLKLAMEILGYDLTEEQWDELESEPETPDAPIMPMAPIDAPVTETPPAQPDVIEPMAPVDDTPMMSVDTMKELEIWQRKAIRAFKASGSAAVEFTAEYLSAADVLCIGERLSECKDIDSIKRVFATVNTVQPDPLLVLATELRLAREALTI